MPAETYPRSTLLAYAAPALPLAALTLPVYIYLPTVYANQLGLGLTLVGTVLLLARLWDVVSDPVVGVLSDATRWRLGRRRTWVLAGTPLVMLAVWFLLAPAGDVGPGYLLGWSLALYLGWTMMILPLTAWGAELSGDYHERTRITAFREGAVLTGTLLALALPAALGLTAAEEGRAAMRTVALGVSVLLPLCVGLLIAFTPEPRVVARGRLDPRSGAALIARNAPFRRLIVAYLINGVANGLPATLFLLYVGNVLQAGQWAGALLVVYFGSGIAAVPLWLSLSRRMGKHRAWIAAMVWACAVFVWVPLLGAGDVWWFVAVCVLTGLSLGADLVLPSAMQADVVDLDTLESGTQRTGVYFALWGMATKLALALAVGLAFPLLDLAGFQDGADNSAFALFALAALYALVPVIFKSIAIVLMHGYPITAASQAGVRERLEAGAGQESEEVMPGATRGHGNFGDAVGVGRGVNADGV